MDGNEYFTAFDGETGKTIDTIYYPIPRLDYESWGDTNGNRCDRYVASVAWLDGQRPYAVYWRSGTAADNTVTHFISATTTLQTIISNTFPFMSTAILV